MEKMGKYCKAYPIDRLSQYSEWSIDADNLRSDKKSVEGKEVEVKRTLDDVSFLYLQEDFTVTDGIFLNKNVVFESNKPEWIDFCKNILRFEVPVYELKSDSAISE